MSPTIYAAPHATTPINAVVHVPGSKSITNRALILSALAERPSTIRGALRSRDTDLMIEALRNLGTSIVEVIPEGAKTATTLRVTPKPLHGGNLYCGLAGTLLRFLPSVAALAEGQSYFDADDQARQRPLSTVLDALREIGVEINGSSIPFTVEGTGRVRGGDVTIDASESSQFVSGLMLSAARFDNGIRIKHDSDKPVPSQPHIDMTVDMLTKHGVHVDTHTPNVWNVSATPIKAYDWDVEPDLSNATPFLAAAAITGGTVTIADWPVHTTQPGDAIRGILEQMGCTIERTKKGLSVTGPAALNGIDIDMGDMGELAPTVAALACCANSPSQLRGISHLRGHETNRLVALVKEINRLGGDAEETADGLIIRPREMRGTDWYSYADHRMATAGTIVGLQVPGVKVQDIETTSKTLPGFAEAWTDLFSQDSSTTPEVWL